MKSFTVAIEPFDLDRFDFLDHLPEPNWLVPLPENERILFSRGKHISDLWVTAAQSFRATDWDCSQQNNLLRVKAVFTTKDDAATFAGHLRDLVPSVN